MGKLYFMIGIARSGKSTIAKQWETFGIDIEHGEIRPRLFPHYQMKGVTELPRVVVCADDIRLTFGFRFNWRMENYVHAIKETMIRALLEKHDVLSDGTHSTVGSVKALLNIDINADYCRMETSVEECCKRARDTNQPDLIPVIERMDKQLASLPPVDEIREEVRKSQSFKTVV
jgi:hypothetical protein